jgi:hypothetical protein
MPSIAQRRFTSGEIAPAYYPGVDLAKYAAACRTIQNFLVKRTGGLDNRPGFEMIGELPFTFSIGRLIPFIFNDDQTYQLYFTDKKIFFAKNGAFLQGALAPGIGINSITQANPGVVNVAASPGVINEGDIVQFGVNGMTQLNGHTYMAKNVSGSNFEIWSPDGVTKISTTGYGAFSATGSYVNMYLAYSSPFAVGDLQDLQFVQSADTLTFTHKKYPPWQLKRSSDTVWTGSNMVFTIQTTTPTVTDYTTQIGGDHGSAIDTGPYGYCVTAVDATTLEESSPSDVWRHGNDVSVTTGRFNTLSWNAVTNAKYYKVYKTNSYLGTMGFVANATGTSYTDAYPGSVPDYTNTPPEQKDPFNIVATISNVVIANNHTLTITATKHGFGNGQQVLVTGVVGTGSMSTVNNVVGTVTVIDANSFTLTASGTPYGTGGYTYTSGGTAASQDLWPATVNYYQERLGFANQVYDPIGTFLSRSGIYKNFSSSTPVKDDDSVQFDSVAREVNEIRHLIDAGTLIILTSNGEHVVHGDVAGTLKPTAINRKKHKAYGSATLRPIETGDSVIFLQKEGAQVFDLGIDMSYGIVRVDPKELTLFAPHLTEGLKITDWAYQKIPHSIVWSRRSDGQLLGMTYIKGQEIAAWHQHTIGDGLNNGFENVSTNPENGETAVYVVTKRTINGTAHRFLERMYQRRGFVNNPLKSANWALKSSAFLDCSLTYDGRNQDGSVQIAITAGTGWTYQDTVSLTASSATFAASDVGKYYFVLSPDGTVARIKITAYASSTLVTGQPVKTIPVALRGVATWQWARAVTQLTNLYHLEGQSLGVVADGFVIASPNNVNENYPPLAPSGGAITLPQPCAYVQAGIPFIATMQTLDVDSAQSETVAGKFKLIDNVTLYLEKSRGGFCGSMLQDDDASNPTDGLSELASDFDADDETPPELITDVRVVDIQSEWNTNGRVVVRQVDPLPFTLNGIVPKGLVPFGGGT